MINESINKYWRDWAALVYLFLCLCDFFAALLWWNLLMDAYCNKMVDLGKMCDATRWEPLTLQMGGMFHISFAAILGVHTWRKKDEMEMAHRIKIDTDGDGVPDTEIIEKSR